MKLISKLKKSKKFQDILLLIIELCFSIYVFSIPSFGESDSLVHYLIYFSLIVLGILSILYCLLFKPIKINRVLFILVPFIIFAFFSTAIYSRKFGQWLTICLLYLSFVIFFITLFVIRDANKVFLLISLSLFVFSLYYIFHYRPNKIFEALSSSTVRLGSDFDNENAVALYSLIGVSSSLYVILFTKYKFRLLFIPPILSLLVVGLTTGSKMFYLLFFIVVIIYLYFIFRKHKLIYFTVVVASIFGFIGLLMLPFMTTIRDRLLSSIQTLFGTTNRADTSTIQRFVYMDYGFFLGTKNAFFGYGCGGFANYSGVDTYSHSNFAETICNFGVIGFSLFYLPLIIPIVFSYKYNIKDKQIIYAFTIFFIMLGISYVFYYNKFYYLILAILYYLTFVKGHANIENEKLFNKIEKIAIVCDSLNAGGAERVISSLANEFNKKRISVSIVTLSNDTFRFYDLSNEVLVQSLCSTGAKFIRFLKKIFKLIKFLKADKPDVVLSFLPLSNFYCFIACKCSNTKYVVSERNDPNHDPKNKLLRKLKELSFKYADGCVFQTDFAKEYYFKEVHDKSIVIFNPVYIDNALAPSIKKEHTITAVGRLENQKNYPLLFDAFKAFLAKGYNDYVLHIYGDGSLTRNLSKYSEEIGIKNKIKFCGKDSDWLRKEINTSIFVLSSKYEGMPNSLLEALCSGIPCISTDCPIGGPYMLKKEGFELELVNTDAIDLSNRMEKCLSNDYIHRSLENRNRYTGFAPINIADKWLEFCCSLKRQSLF